MSAIKFTLFERGFDPVSPSETESAEARLEFSPGISGNLMIKDRVFTVKDGACLADLSRLDDGCLKPYFYTEDTLLDVPMLKKVGKKVKLAPADDSYLFELAKRCRNAHSRIEALETALGELRAFINGGALYIGEPAD